MQKKNILILLIVIALLTSVKSGPAAFAACIGVSSPLVATCLALIPPTPAFFICLGLKGTIYGAICLSTLFAPTP